MAFDVHSPWFGVLDLFSFIHSSKKKEGYYQNKQYATIQILTTASSYVKDHP